MKTDTELNNEGWCPTSPDTTFPIHCDHWFDYETCHYCGSAHTHGGTLLTPTTPQPT